MERRYLKSEECPVSIENRSDSQPVIMGRAAVFYDGTPETEFVLCDAVIAEDGRMVYPALIERINPKAFNKAINDRHDVRALFNHDPNLILGRTSSGTLKLSKSLRGLDYEVDPGKTTVANDVMEHIRRGDVSGSSFGFRVLPDGQKFTYDEERQADIREILSVELLDVSPVCFPAYGSTTTAVRSDADMAECRSAYNSWKTSVAEQRDAATARDQRLAEIKARRDEVSA